MRQFWFGISVLAVLLALCAAAGGALRVCTSATTRTLLQAEQACLQGDETAMRSLTRQAQQQWDARADFFGAILCHDDLELVRAEFVRLQSHAQTLARADYLCSCSQLIDLLEQLPRSEQLSLHNLL